MVSKKISKDSWDLKRARRYPYPYPRKQNPSESEVAKVPWAQQQPDGGEAHRGAEPDGCL
jgi:hypothetical protein